MVILESINQYELSNNKETRTMVLTLNLQNYSNILNSIFSAFKEELIDKWVITANDATLECVTVGDQEATFVWKKDSVAFTSKFTY